MTILETVTLTTAIIGAACGISGTVLGLINTWSQVSRNRVRLKVIPKLAFMVGGDLVISGVKRSQLQQRLANSGAPARWCLEVVNLSEFAVTISDVGFGRSNRVRHVLVHPEILNGKSWPVRLEPREAVTLYAQIGETLDPRIMQQPYAYAETDCGVVCYGTSPIFKDHLAAITSRQGEEN